MKRTNSFLLIICIIFFSFCSSSVNEGIASISDKTTTTYIISEEDYPIVLTQCLNEEKGYKIATPFDLQDLKTTISQLSKNKEEESKLGEDVNYCITKYSLWSDQGTANPQELAKLYDENLELARCLRENGLNVADPSQLEPKLDLSSLKESKEETMPLLEKCGFGEEKGEK